MVTLGVIERMLDEDSYEVGALGVEIASSANVQGRFLLTKDGPELSVELTTSGFAFGHRRLVRHCRCYRDHPLLLLTGTSEAVVCVSM